MVKYTSKNQLSIEEFKTPFRLELKKENRWVCLSEQIPWDDFAGIYSRALRLDFGRTAISPQTVIGVLIIKHMLGLSDKGRIEIIQENPYMSQNGSLWDNIFLDFPNSRKTLHLTLRYLLPFASDWEQMHLMK